MFDDIEYLVPEDFNSSSLLYMIFGIGFNLWASCGHSNSKFQWTTLGVG